MPPQPARARASAGRSSERGVAAVNRALTVVAAFDGQLEPLTLAELAQRTRLYKSTLLRLIASLEAFGYLVRLPDGRYHLGPAPFRLGATYQRASGLADLVMPVMRDLVARGTESPSFHVPYDDERRLCTLRIDSNHSTLDTVSAGALLPLARGAAGKLILAFTGGRGGELDRIRKSFFAVSYGERDPECAGVACPVFDAQGKLVGVLSLSGPKARFTKDAVKRMTGLLFDAVIRLTAALGGNTQPLLDAKPGARP